MKIIVNSKLLNQSSYEMTLHKHKISTNKCQILIKISTISKIIKFKIKAANWSQISTTTYSTRNTAHLNNLYRQKPNRASMIIPEKLRQLRKWIDTKRAHLWMNLHTLLKLVWICSILKWMRQLILLRSRLQCS